MIKATGPRCRPGTECRVSAIAESLERQRERDRQRQTDRQREGARASERERARIARSERRHRHVAAQPGQKQVYYTNRETTCPIVTTVTPRRRTAAKLAPRRIQKQENPARGSISQKKRTRNSDPCLFLQEKIAVKVVKNNASAPAEAEAFPATPSQAWPCPHFVSLCPCLCLCVLAGAPPRPRYLDGLLHL